MQAWNDPDVAGKSCSIAETRGVACFGDNGSSREGTDSRDRGKQSPHLLAFKPVLNVSFKFARSGSHCEYIVASIADLSLAGFRLMLANGGLGG